MCLLDGYLGFHLECRVPNRWLIKGTFHHLSPYAIISYRGGPADDRRNSWTLCSVVTQSLQHNTEKEHDAMKNSGTFLQGVFDHFGLKLKSVLTADPRKLKRRNVSSCLMHCILTYWSWTTWTAWRSICSSVLWDDNKHLTSWSLMASWATLHLYRGHLHWIHAVDGLIVEEPNESAPPSVAEQYVIPHILFIRIF